MSNSEPIVIVLTDTESDSDLKQLADAVFSQVQEKSLKRKTKTNDSKAFVKNIATTTTVETVSRSKRYSTRSKTKEKEKESETDSLTKSQDTEAINFPFFIDTKPSEIGLADKLLKCTSTKGKEDDVSVEKVDQMISSDESDDSDSDSEAEVQGKSNSDRAMELSSSLQTGLDPSDLYINVNSLKQNKAGLRTVQGLEKNMAQLVKERDEEIMKKSVLTPDFEKQERCLPYSESQRKLKQERRKQRSKTKGNGWFNMPATELTEERKNDLKVLQMRHALDPKRFYRANDMMAAPKYFQFGTVVESKADFYSSRIPKKERKATLVDELMADVDFRKFNKRKYSEIQEAKRTGSGPYRKTRFPKKKKKTKF